MEQRISSGQPGRRGSDLWSRAGKIMATLLTGLALLGAAGQVWEKSHQINQNQQDILAGHVADSLLTERVAVLEIFKRDDHYMTCSLYEKAFPDYVPASCESALRAPIGKSK